MKKFIAYPGTKKDEVMLTQIKVTILKVNTFTYRWGEVKRTREELNLL